MKPHTDTTAAVGGSVGLNEYFETLGGRILKLTFLIGHGVLERGLIIWRSITVRRFVS